MFFCFLETKWPLVFLCCFLFAKNWILLQLPTWTFYENVNYDSICKKRDHFKRLKKKTKPHFFPHQCSNSTDVIFLFDFSKFIFVVLIIIFCRRSIFVTVGIQKKRQEKKRNCRPQVIHFCQSCNFKKLKWPVEQVFTLSLIKKMVSHWFTDSDIKHWEPDQMIHCNKCHVQVTRL